MPCLQVAEEVLAAAPPDDHVLNMLLLVLKPANRVQDVLPAYEAACSKQPKNEDLLQGLFACHVRWVWRQHSHQTQLDGGAWSRAASTHVATVWHPYIP